jgi:hypothetical protein
LDGIKIFFKKKIARIQNQYFLPTFSDLLYPCSPSGQTAKTIPLVSARTGIDLTINIIAVKEGEGRGWILSIARIAMVHPKKPESQKYYEEPYSFHTVHPLVIIFNIYTLFIL